MATTTNFGWETPDDTDLVKDGAAAIRTALGGVDTSFVDLKGGTTGQVLAKASNTDLDFVWSADAAGMTNPMTTTGDTIYSSSGSTPARLGIGSTGQVLTVAGGVPTWATASAGGKSYTLLNSGGTTLSGATTTVSGISAKDSIYVMIQGARSNTAGDTFYLQFNSDTGTNYQWYGFRYRSQLTYSTANATIDGNSGNDKFFICDNSDSASSTWQGGFTINGAASTNPKMIVSQIGTSYVANANDAFYKWLSAVYNGTSAISSITFGSRYGSLNAGTVFVYASA